MESLLGSAVPANNTTNFSNDPWTPVPPAPVPDATLIQNDPWAAFENSKAASPGTPNSINNGTATNDASMQRNNVKTPESFLGKNSSLVNLNNLMGPSTAQHKSSEEDSTRILYGRYYLASNPFIIGSSLSNNTSSTNPFSAQQRPSPSLNEVSNMLGSRPSIVTFDLDDASTTHRFISGG